MITETLAARDLTLRPVNFQTQLLKLYFLTTLYVDVKEPALRTIETTKKLNLDRCGPLLLKQQRFKRDKIEPICSPKMYVERTPK